MTELDQLRSRIRRAREALGAADDGDKLPSRVFFDLDVTPHRVPSDPGRVIETIPGYRPLFVAKNAHLNLMGKPAGANHEDPPTDDAVRACAAAAKKAGVPLVWDVEHTASLNFYDGQHFDPTVKQRREAMRHWLRIMRLSRDVLGKDHELYQYHYPQSTPSGGLPELADEDAQLGELLTGPCYELYNWGIENGDGLAASWWWKNRAENEARLRQFPAMRDKPGVVFVHPFWGGTKQPLPILIWQWQVNALLAPGTPWRDVCVWMGDWPLPPVEEHVRWAAGKAAK